MRDSHNHKVVARLRCFIFLLVAIGAATVALAQPAAYVDDGQPTPVAPDAAPGALPNASNAPAVGAPVAATPVGRIRNVILIIGDGMGPQEVGLLTLYARHAPHSVVPSRQAALERLYNEGGVGLMRPEPHGALVVDSAAASTQMASGQLAGSEMIGVDYFGNPTRTICEIARDLGKSTGLVTDTRVTHATPAGFAAHQPQRFMENEIAADMLASKVDVMLGGGLRHWVPQSVADTSSTAYAGLLQTTGGQFPVSSKRKDDRNLLVEARADYQLVFDRFALGQVKSGRVLGLFADSEMDDALLEKSKHADDALRNQPSLVEMSMKTIDLLNQNPKGFFLMVEGGQIDWCGHNNDAGSMLHELLRLDNTIREIMRWASQRDDTLILVTGDHETGGFGFSYTGRPLPQAAKLSGASFKGTSFKPNFNYAAPKLLDQLYAQKKSFYSMMLEFDGLPPQDRTAEKLVEIVNSASAFKINLADAVAILTRTTNRNYVDGHPFLATRTVPLIRDFEAFYVYGENLRMNLLGRRLSAQQHIVWGAGTHTSTPVVIGAYGPADAVREFGGMFHATEMARRMIKLLGGEPAPPAGESANP